jgi:hypothetical protein
VRSEFAVIVREVVDDEGQWSNSVIVVDEYDVELLRKQTQ